MITIAIIFFFSSRKKEKKPRKKKHKKEKQMQKREGAYLSSPTSTFGMKHSFCLLLSTFLKPCVLRLLEALSYSSSGALPSSGDGVSGK